MRYEGILFGFSLVRHPLRTKGLHALSLSRAATINLCFSVEQTVEGWLGLAPELDLEVFLLAHYCIEQLPSTWRTKETLGSLGIIYFPLTCPGGIH